MVIKLSVLSVIVALLVPVRRYSCHIRSIRGLSTLRTRVLMTARTVLATLEMIELSPAELRPGPISVTWRLKTKIILIHLRVWWNLGRVKF